MNSRNQISMHPLDAAYALAFFFLLIYYVAGVSSIVIQPPRQAGLLWWDRFYLVLVALILTAQLLRMYYHLKDFEAGIAAPGKSHFLELLPMTHSKWERTIRVMIAVVLVLFSKVGGELNLTMEISNLPVDLTPGITLAICFIFLLSWDVAVWCGFRRADSNGNKQAWMTARRFYYLPSAFESPQSVGTYFSEFKFFERLCGLGTAISAIAYVSTRDGYILVFMIGFALSVPLISSLGYHRSGLRPKYVKSIWDLGILALLPFFSLWELYEGKSTMNSNNLNITRRRIIIAVFVFLAIFIFCLVWQWPSDQSNGPTSTSEETIPLQDTSKALTRVRIATSKNLWCALTLIAHERNYFLAEGLHADVNYQAAGRLNMDALISGTVDFANVVETNIAYQALNRIPNLAVHGRIVSATDYAIITKASAKIQQPQDLKGKRLAYAQATGAESFVFWFMEEEDISNSNINLVPLQPAGIVDHFLGGKSEAVAAWEPFVSTIQSRSRDIGKVFYARSDGFTGIMLVATKRDWATSHPSVVQAYERAMNRAARFVLDSVSVAQRIISDQTGLPLETVITVWNRFDLKYVQTLDRETRLVEEVVRRIQVMLPEMRNRKPEGIHQYFGMTK